MINEYVFPLTSMVCGVLSLLAKLYTQACVVENTVECINVRSDVPVTVLLFISSFGIVPILAPSLITAAHILLTHDDW